MKALKKAIYTAFLILSAFMLSTCGDSKEKTGTPSVKDIELSTDEDTALTITLDTFSPGGKILSFTTEGGPSHGVIGEFDYKDGEYKAVYTPNPNFNGSDTFLVQGSNGTKQSRQATVTITVNPVNDEPSLSGAPITTIDQGSQYSFTVVGEDVDIDTVLTYSGSNLPGWLTINSITGEVSGTPSNDDIGTFTGLIVCVSDKEAPDVCLEPFDVSVSNINDNPIIIGNPWVIAIEEQPYSDYSFVSWDIDEGDSFNWSLAGPTWLSIDSATGELGGTPQNSDVGTNDFTVMAIDSNGGIGYFDFSIIVLNTNDPPTIGGTPDTTVDEDTPYSFKPYGVDEDIFDLLYFSIANKASWMAFNRNTGEISGTPENDDVGTTAGITICVNDGVSPPACLSPFSVTVNNVNDAPEVWGTPLAETATDAPFVFEPGSLDVDPTNDVLTFSIVNTPGWASFDTTTGALSGIPTEADIPVTGSQVYANVDICVSDGIAATPTCLGAFSITVTDGTPPAPATGLTIWNEDNQVEVSWLNPGSADLAGVVLLRRSDGVYPTGLDDPHATEVTDTLLQGVVENDMAAGSYHYAAFARDELPNYAQPVTIIGRPFDPFTRERIKLNPSDMNEQDYYGFSVSISGDTALVGARNEDGGTGTVTCYLIINAGSACDAGAVYVIQRNSATRTWSEVDILRASNYQQDDLFGASVSINGDDAVIGAYGEDGAGDTLFNSGAAYVFLRDQNGIWSETTILRPSDARASDHFGMSVSISGDHIIVGSPDEDGPSNFYSGAGAAYVFQRNAGVWNETAILHASDLQPGDEFGTSVSISGDLAIVGAMLNDTRGPSAGAAYVFRRNTITGVWSQEAILYASDAQAQDAFGHSVGISGSYAIVGAHLEDGGAGTVTCGDPSYTGTACGVGAAYIFERNPTTGTWSEVSKHHSLNPQEGEYFGYSVAISGNSAIVGANWNNTLRGNSGSAYIIRRNSATGIWEGTAEILASDNYDSDEFGYSVSISDDHAIAGAPGEDGGEGHPYRETGAAYIFD